MSLKLYAYNVCLLGIKSKFKFHLQSKCIHTSIPSKKVTPQEVYIFNDEILVYYYNYYNTFINLGDFNSQF